MTRQQIRKLHEIVPNNTCKPCYSVIKSDTRGSLHLWGLSREGNIIWLEYESADFVGRQVENLSDFDNEDVEKIIIALG